MSNREYVQTLIDAMDENQLQYVISILDGINGLMKTSDAYDLALALDSEEDNDEEYTLDEVNRILGRS